MSPNAKRMTALVFIAIGFIVETKGIGMLAGSMGDHHEAVKGAIYCAIGLAVGLPAAILNLYYRETNNWFPSKEKTETETIASINKNKRA